MHKSVILSLVCVLLHTFYTAAAPIEESGRFARQLLDTMRDKIITEEYTNIPREDGYSYSFRTSDGTVRMEEGIIMNPGTDNEELVVMGSYEFTDGDTTTVTMYTADKNGYRPRVELKNRKLNPKLLASLAG